MTRLTQKTRNIFAASLLITGVLTGAVACTSGDGEPDSETGGGAGAPGTGGKGNGGTGPGGAGSNLDEDELIDQAAEQYSKVVSATYVDAHASALVLKTAIAEFLADPTEETLTAAKKAWLASREPYLKSEAFRFYDGPIDNPDDGPEGQLNAWPLDENYIDYVKDDPDAGIVNDPEIEITAEKLSSLNEEGGEKNIATGYHAIEFLLWGQDFSADGPGNRPVSDYTTADNADRRAEYLKVVTDLLVSDLEFLVESWATGESNYRKEFLAAAPDEKLRRVLTGLILLSGTETGGERLQAAYDSEDQEDEHSCFSDNTHRDMVGDILGIQDVYLGRYKTLGGQTLSGTSLDDVVRAKDAKLADEVKALIEQSLERAEALKPPFDQEIVTTEGRKRVEALIESLRFELEPSLEKVFRLFELTIPSPE
jgi:putative iron-regulated protein